ncbi:MAG: dihydrodipicolinate synthase family protein [Gemmatimonadota bacterium]|nr:dihydrodipicolinate synthase family protein [Gemmatimonadota bacterium]MDH3366646.1 dihydrodipicolinate synthase family protein [Gemmatimonadota bacterium]MDH3477255.1 dihydrodipicolinate synthase family protein [Gemmatimonadota bacterium]MDH3570392.1 dihydrodipicolinate synthase family protein [Gemmatimonadota bacterium]MDH5549985.1 dihydrodipicolinate synthase family protein [Gemmatimonadota bacterium]
MTERPRGLLVPVTTPFDPTTGDVAPVHLRDNVRAVLAAGAAGIVAAGSTGEASLLSEAEFRQVVAWMRDVVPDGRWLVAGSGRESTRATIEACGGAAEAGADAALVRAPSYYGPVFTSASLIDHFRMVADASPIPIILYNFPRYTHVALTEQIVAALAKHENIWGAKDSSGDLKMFAAFQDAAPKWSLFVGPGALFYPALELGAAGAIAAVACFAAGPTVAVYQAFDRGDRAASGAAQERVAPLHRVIVGELGVPGIKLAMDVVGLFGGSPRPPIPPLGDKDRRRIVDLLREAELLHS